MSIVKRKRGWRCGSTNCTEEQHDDDSPFQTIKLTALVGLFETMRQRHGDDTKVSTPTQINANTCGVCSVVVIARTVSLLLLSLFARSWKLTRWNVAAPAFPGEKPRHFLAPQPPIPLERKRKFTPTDGSGGEKKLRERVEEKRRVGRQAAGRKARCEESDTEDRREPSAHLEATLC